MLELDWGSPSLVPLRSRETLERDSRETLERDSGETLERIISRMLMMRSGFPHLWCGNAQGSHAQGSHTFGNNKFKSFSMDFSKDFPGILPSNLRSQHSIV